MSRFNHKRAIFIQNFKIFADKAILHPVLANLSSFAVCNKFIRIEGDIEIEIVVYHYSESAAFQAFPWILVNRKTPDATLWSESIAIDAPTFPELLKKFRGEFFMPFFWDIAQRISKGKPFLRRAQFCVTARCSADSRFENGLRWEFVKIKRYGIWR
jgi:hypothetical protein